MIDLQVDKKLKGRARLPEISETGCENNGYARYLGFSPGIFFFKQFEFGIGWVFTLGISSNASNDPRHGALTQFFLAISLFLRSCCTTQEMIMK